MSCLRDGHGWARGQTAAIVCGLLLAAGPARGSISSNTPYPRCVLAKQVKGVSHGPAS